MVAIWAASVTAISSLSSLVFFGKAFWIIGVSITIPVNDKNDNCQPMSSIAAAGLANNVMAAVKLMQVKNAKRSAIVAGHQERGSHNCSTHDWSRTASK